jgi:hypothetical protein
LKTVFTDLLAVQTDLYSLSKYQLFRLPSFANSKMSSKLSATATPFVPADADFELVSTPITEPDKAAFSYPFSCISTGEEESWCATYDTDDFCEGLLGEEKDGLSCGKFPDNIVEFYWLHEGHNDEDAWECLCKLDNGNFAYYSAWCDYTGFDCQGGMKLIVSKDLKRLFYEGLTDRSRDLCLKEKKAPPKPNTKTYRSDLARARDSEPFKWDVPVAPEPKPAAEATRAFIRVWENGKELTLNLDNVNGLEMEVLEEGIRGLTAQFLTPKGSPKPKKKFYAVNICSSSPAVSGIDDYFKRRFGNPDKKWELRLKTYGGGSIVRKWGKVEVSFILF